MDINKEIEMIQNNALIRNAKRSPRKYRTELLNSYVEPITNILLKKYGSSDLIGEAILAFNDAIDRYIPNKKTTLLSYAYPSIIAAVNLAINDNRYSNGNLIKVKKCREKFFATYGYEPDKYELAEEYNLQLKDIELADFNSKRNIVPITNIEIEDTEYEEDDGLVIPNGLLTISEKAWLTRYLKGKTNTEICAELHKKRGYYKDYFDTIVNKLKKYECESKTVKEGAETY